MNHLNEIVFHLKKICELLEAEQSPNKQRPLTMKEIMSKYNVPSTVTNRLVYSRNSPAYRIGHDWRVDEDDFIFWFSNFKHDAEKELNQHVNKEKRLVFQEADLYSRLLYGMKIRDYIASLSTEQS